MPKKQPHNPHVHILLRGGMAGHCGLRRAAAPRGHAFTMNRKAGTCTDCVRAVNVKRDLAVKGAVAA